jgi:hypothetical protein
MWFSVNRRAGNVILHHNRIRSVLIREWSREMDGIAAAIWASSTTASVRETLGDGVGRCYCAVAQPERQGIVAPLHEFLKPHPVLSEPQRIGPVLGERDTDPE